MLFFFTIIINHLHVGLLLLHQCDGYCKLVHLTRSMPSLWLNFGNDIHQCFGECTSIDYTDQAWQQAQLSLIRCELGLHCLSHQSSAAYIASLTASGSNHHHLVRSIQYYNCFNFHLLRWFQLKQLCSHQSAKKY